MHRTPHYVKSHSELKGVTEPGKLLSGTHKTEKANTLSDGEPERVGLRFLFPAQEQEGTDEKAPASWTLIFVPGTVPRALTKKTTLQTGGRTLSILEMRELRPREGTCPRPHTQKWWSWDQTLLWWIPEVPCLFGAFWGHTHSHDPQQRP